MAWQLTIMQHMCYIIPQRVKDFPEEFMKISTSNYNAILQLYGFSQKRFLVETH